MVNLAPGLGFHIQQLKLFQAAPWLLQGSWALELQSSGEASCKLAFLSNKNLI